MEKIIPLDSLPECLLQDLAALAGHLEEHLPHAEHAQLSIDDLKKPRVGVSLIVRGWDTDGQS